MPHSRTRSPAGASQRRLPSTWRLRYDIVSTRALLVLVGGAAREDVNPDVHLFLADRYGRLADRALWNGAAKRARRLQARAEWHYERAGFDDFPSAAAMAMPAPRPKLFIDARARPLRRDEDDAA